jgi:uncharacterized protein YbjT (DUF2867 family)
MPVLVTAAHQPLARRLAARLLEEGGEVRVTAAGDVTSLRAAGAFVASATSDDEGRLEAALTDVHTLVHVGGGLATRDVDRIVADAEVAARAAAGAGVRRVIALSVAGASPDASDPLRRAKAAMETVLADLPCPTIVLRLGLVDTPVLRDALVTAGLDPVNLGVVVRPVRLADVLELVVAFDRARARSTEGHLVVAADGPQAMSVAGYLDRVTGSPAGRGRLLGRRLPDPATIERLVAALNGPWEQTEPHLVDGWSFAQLEPGVPGPSGG